jgi:hypothetical protein
MIVTEVDQMNGVSQVSPPSPQLDKVQQDAVAEGALKLAREDQVRSMAFELAAAMALIKVGGTP